LSRTRRILSNFSVVNIVLAAVLIVFANNMFLPLLGKSSKLTVPSPKKQAAVPSKTDEKSPAESKSPSPSDYFLIAEQNIFHPERKIPVEKKDAAAEALPKPEFVLYGTLIEGDLRIAYMEDKKAPQNAPTRGKKQIPLRVGEALSGFVLREIDADKVVMVRGEEKLAVSLNDPSKSKTRESSAAAPGTQAATPGQQPTQAAPSTSPQQKFQRPPGGAAAAARSANPQPMPQPMSQPTPQWTPQATPGNPADAFRRLFNRR
jgi:hypothetical protein